MRYFFLILFFTFFTYSLKAAQTFHIIGARALSMGGISLLPEGFWSVFNNQAGLSSINTFGVGIAYNSHFGIDKNLSLKSAAFVIPTNSGTFGLTINYFGYSAFHQQKLGLAFGKSLGDVLSMGIQIDYLSTVIGNDYGKANAFTFEIGILAKINPSLQIAAHLYNPFMVKLGKVFQEITAAVFSFSTAYHLDSDILILAEFEQRSLSPGILKLGMEYQLIETIFIRAGLATKPQLFSFGIGLIINGINLDIGSSYHQILGFSPNVSMHYMIK